jgi:chemotaxis protein CheD
MAELANTPFSLSQSQQIYTLHPGDVACGERGDRLETLLGSCVAIILTDPRRTIGAMCHIVHAGQRGPGKAVLVFARLLVVDG